MFKRLVLSPELLLLAPLPAQRRGVGAALRQLVERHGEMPVHVGMTDQQGEVDVVDGFHVLDRVVFPVEDWCIPEAPAIHKRLVG